jgi:hypothetical protein
MNKKLNNLNTKINIYTITIDKFLHKLAQIIL